MIIFHTLQFLHGACAAATAAATAAGCELSVPAMARLGGVAAAFRRVLIIYCALLVGAVVFSASPQRFARTFDDGTTIQWETDDAFEAIR